MFYDEKYKECRLKELNRRFSKPNVLVAYEKHGTAFLDASTLDALYKSSLSLVKFRRKNGYYYEPKAPTPKQPSLTKEQVALLPDGAVKKAAQMEWQQYKRAFVSYNEDLEFINSVDEAIKNDDGLLAYIILKDRTDYEYERVELEPIYSAYGE